MASSDLIEQLLALPDVAAQKQFLEAHVVSLDDEFAHELKRRADQRLRADIKRCLATIDLLYHMATLTGNPLHRALGLLAEANAHSIGLGEYQEAIQLYEDAAEIYAAHDCLVDRAIAQIGKLWPLASLGHYDEALEAGRWAADTLEAHAQWLHLAKLTSNLGIIHGRMGQDAEALSRFDRARELYKQLGEEGSSYLPRVEYNRAHVLRNLGQFEASIQASQAALAYLADLDQAIDAARAQQGLAITYFVQGKYNEALELLAQVGDVFLADGRQRDAILVELFISDCLTHLRRFSDVLEKCRQVRDHFTELGTRFEVAQAILNEAVAYTGLRRYGEALVSLAEARRLFEQEENQVWMAYTDLEQAVVFYYQGRLEMSLTAAEACAGVFQASDLPIKEAQAQLIAARAAAGLERHEQAQDLVGKALAVGQTKDIPALTYPCRHLLGTLAEAQGDLQSALAEYDRAIQEVERLRGRLMVEFRADFLTDKQVVYEDVVRLCLDLDRPLQGLEYAERAKSRTLLDMLAYRLDLSISAKNEQDLHLVEELVGLRSERNRLYRRLETDEKFRVRGGAPTSGGPQQVQREVLFLEKRITELWHKLLIRNADYARDAALWQVRTEPVQPYLPPESVLLEYFIIRQQLIAFVVTGEAVQAYSLPGGIAQFQRLLQLLWLNLKAVPKSTPSQVVGLSRNARGILERLHGQLIAPLADLLSPHPQLIIVPHGPLHYLPFHALYDGTSFLLERHEISYLPSASMLRYCREGHPAESGALIVGHSCEGRLPHTIHEARAIAGLLGEPVCLEEEATLNHLRDSVEDCRLVHLAAHGEFRPDNPLFSGLALSDGWLTTLDTFNLRLKASLVTLSACQTGRSVVGGGDELLGLMRAFLYAGAASLVLSLWAVEDRSTARLMETFYGKLASGWTKGAALRDAQQQCLRGALAGESGAYTHPYFWAPFFLVGEASGRY